MAAAAENRRRACHIRAPRVRAVESKVLPVANPVTAAREAIAEARETGPAKSPLADSIERSRKREKERPPKPEPPREPAWLQNLTEPDRRRVRALVKRLEAAGIPDADAIARAEIADEQPALARLAIERRLAEAQDAKDPPEGGPAGARGDPRGPGRDHGRPLATRRRQRAAGPRDRSTLTDEFLARPPSQWSAPAVMTCRRLRPSRALGEAGYSSAAMRRAV